MTPEEIDAIRRIAYKMGYDDGETVAVKFVVVLVVVVFALIVLIL